MSKNSQSNESQDNNEKHWIKVPEYDQRLDIHQKREYKVVKANEIIQRAKYELDNTELKIMTYIFSMIKPTDEIGKVYSFSIQEFCQVCGLNASSGKHYQTIKAKLKKIRDKSFWLVEENGSSTTVGWLNTVTITPQSGVIKVKLQDELSKYVVGLLGGSYTQYELISTLPMKSAYSIRMYELLKSYAYQHKPVILDVDVLKGQIFATHYKNFKDFRVKVIEKAVKEINLYSDLEVVQWEPVSKGRKVIQIKFIIREKPSKDRLFSYIKAHEELDKNQVEGQMSLADYVNTPEDVTIELIDDTKKPPIE
ncbi:MAG: replication initiation protein [Lachnospiraceae bacterium]|nr:replication initiation protein [Lachnospiraceae bacterium]